MCCYTDYTDYTGYTDYTDCTDYTDYTDYTQGPARIISQSIEIMAWTTSLKIKRMDATKLLLLQITYARTRRLYSKDANAQFKLTFSFVIWAIRTNPFPILTA